MRRADAQQLGVFRYASIEARAPNEHPIRKLRVLADTILSEFDPMFAARRSPVGRVSTPPERLLRAMLLQVVYSVRGERLVTKRVMASGATLKRPARGLERLLEAAVVADESGFGRSISSEITIPHRDDGRKHGWMARMGLFKLLGSCHVPASQ